MEGALRGCKRRVSWRSPALLSSARVHAEVEWSQNLIPSLGASWRRGKTTLGYLGNQNISLSFRKSFDLIKLVASLMGSVTSLPKLVASVAQLVASPVKISSWFGEVSDCMAPCLWEYRGKSE